MLRFGRLSQWHICALAVTGCATMNVSSHVAARYRLRAIPHVRLGTGRRAADRRSATRSESVLPGPRAGRGRKAAGCQRTSSVDVGTPDLLIHYHASINQRIDVNGVDREYGYCYDDDCQAESWIRSRHTRARHRRRPHEPVDLARLGAGQRRRHARTIATGWRERSTRPLRGCWRGFRRGCNATMAVRRRGDASCIRPHDHYDSRRWPSRALALTGCASMK